LEKICHEKADLSSTQSVCNIFDSNCAKYLQRDHFAGIDEEEKTR
jgi:hypothetical protein